MEPESCAAAPADADRRSPAGRAQRRSANLVVALVLDADPQLPDGQPRIIVP
ncbi:hypothetical protein [Krasilnikovia sp. M28-CT-15]|uniref:hypothetical protein n=1 Tax=Krasilnikovia sp. M28-CT-15 TaxID=3373540 RepID=UPI00399D552C